MPFARESAGSSNTYISDAVATANSERRGISVIGLAEQHKHRKRRTAPSTTAGSSSSSSSAVSAEVSEKSAACALAERMRTAMRPSDVPGAGHTTVPDATPPPTLLQARKESQLHFHERPLWPQASEADHAEEQTPLQSHREPRDLLPVGCDVVHAKRGAGRVIDVSPDGGRVVKFVGSGPRGDEVHKYLPGSWHRLTTPAIELLQRSSAEIDWLGLSKVEAPPPASQLTEISFSLDKKRSSTSQRWSISVDQQQLLKGDLVRVELDDEAAPNKKKKDKPVGLVVGKQQGMVSVRLDGKGRTLHFSPSQLVKYPQLSDLGVSLACLRSFIATHKSLVRGLSADAVRQHLLIPLAKSCQSSLADAIQRSGNLPTGDTQPQFVGTANVYVSFSGETNFEALIDGLEEFEAARKADDKPATLYWFSPFSYDPAAETLETMPTLWIRRVFKRHIDAIGHTCIVASYWQEPLALSDPWCILETLSTAASDAQLSVQMVPDDSASFVHALQYHPEQVSQAVLRWCLGTKHAHFYSAAHRQAVTEAVSSLKRFPELDASIAQQLREWAYREAERAVEKLTAEQRGSSPLLHQLAALLMEQGVYAKAEPLLEEASSACSEQLGRHHPMTMKTDELRARLMRMQDKLAEAEAILEDLVERRCEIDGDGCEATASVQEELALVCMAQKKLAEAEPLFRRALKARRKALDDSGDASGQGGVTKPVLVADGTSRSKRLAAVASGDAGKLTVERKQHITTLSNLASLLRAQVGSKLEEAEPLLRECLEEKRALLGDKHPETLIGVNQLGLLLQTMRKPDDAEVLFREALSGRMEVLGAQHPQTLNAKGNLADLLRERGQLGFALQAIGDAAQVASGVLGPSHRVTVALQAKHDRIVAGLQRQAAEEAQGGDSSDDENEAQLKTEDSAALRAKQSASARLSAASFDALMGVLTHTREELLIVLQKADKDNSSTVNMAEFATVLSCLGVGSMGAMDELMVVFGFNWHRTRDIHTLLHIARMERVRHKDAVACKRAQIEERAAKSMRRVLGADFVMRKLDGQVWNTLTLPHYDNHRERFLVQGGEMYAAAGAAGSGSAADLLKNDDFEKMENLAFDPLTKRHRFDDVTLISALGLQAVDDAVNEAGKGRKSLLGRQKSNLNAVLQRKRRQSVARRDSVAASSVALFLNAKQAWMLPQAQPPLSSTLPSDAALPLLFFTKP